MHCCLAPVLAWPGVFLRLVEGTPFLEFNGAHLQFCRSSRSGQKFKLKQEFQFWQETWWSCRTSLELGRIQALGPWRLWCPDSAGGPLLSGWNQLGLISPVQFLHGLCIMGLGVVLNQLRERHTHVQRIQNTVATIFFFQGLGNQESSIKMGPKVDLPGIPVHPKLSVGGKSR